MYLSIANNYGTDKSSSWFSCRLFTSKFGPATHLVLFSHCCRLIQSALQKPLAYMRSDGLLVEFLSEAVMPAGQHFFDHACEENYAQLYHGNTMIVHNNWIKDHQDKKRRFQDYHLWSEEGTSFPERGGHSCGGHSSIGVFDRAAGGKVLMVATALGVSFVIYAWYASTSLRAGPRRRTKASRQSG